MRKKRKDKRGRIKNEEHTKIVSKVVIAAEVTKSKRLAILDPNASLALGKKKKRKPPHAASHACFYVLRAFNSSWYMPTSTECFPPEVLCARATNSVNQVVLALV